RNDLCPCGWHRAKVSCPLPPRWQTSAELAGAWRVWFAESATGTRLRATETLGRSQRRKTPRPNHSPSLLLPGSRAHPAECQAAVRIRPRSCWDGSGRSGFQDPQSPPPPPPPPPLLAPFFFLNTHPPSCYSGKKKKKIIFCF